MFRLILTLTLLLTSHVSLASITDETNTLTSESITKINKVISQAKEKHNINIKLYLLKSLKGSSPEDLAEKLFTRHKLNTGDMVYLVAQEEKKSRFWIGKDLKQYFTRDEVRYTLDKILPPYFNQRNYEGAFIAVVDQTSIALGDVKFQYLFSEKNRTPESDSSMVWILFFIIPVGILGVFIVKFLANKSRLSNKYPMFEYEKAKEFEKMQATKQRMLAIIKKEHPGESVYKVYRRIAKEYKLNKAEQNKVNARGQDNNSLSIDQFAYIPLYILMFNSPYTPLNFNGHRVNNDGSSSSGCGGGTTSSCGSSDSGGGGGGCGGGGCGGCGS